MEERLNNCVRCKICKFKKDNEYKKRNKAIEAWNRINQTVYTHWNERRKL